MFVAISFVIFRGIFTAVFIPRITFAIDSFTKFIVVPISGDISFLASDSRFVFHGDDDSFAFNTPALSPPALNGFAKGARYFPNELSPPAPCGAACP